MRRTVTLTIVTLGLIVSSSAYAETPAIKSALSAAPPSLAKNATVMSWDKKTLRKGTNGWTCLPDKLDTSGNDPWCVNEPWLDFLDAYKNKKKPSYSQVGVAYMLQGDTPVSNTDPYAKKPKPGDDWVEGLGPHLMMLIPDPKMLKNIPTNSKNGGPWIMWPGTDYAHLMIPIESYPK